MSPFYVLFALALLASCAPTDDEMSIGAVRQANVDADVRGFMLVSDRNPSLAVNAPYATSGTSLILSAGCTWGNVDCTFTYARGQLISDKSTQYKLVPEVINGQIVAGAAIKLMTSCPAAAAPCTWTYSHGRFIYDRTPWLSINAWGGAAHGILLRLNECTDDNPDCTFTMQNAMLQTGDLGPLKMNAWGGAAFGTELRLNQDCTRTNPDCTFTVVRGMILSDRDPHLAVNAFGGAEFGTALRLHDGCTLDNPDCTFTWHQGMILSDRDQRLAINSFWGRAQGTLLRLHDSCTTDNPDCTWGAMVAGPQTNWALTADAKIYAFSGTDAPSLEQLRYVYGVARIRAGGWIPGLPWPNQGIIWTGMDEAKLRLCGSAARSKYVTGSGDWCSEYSIWVQQQSGAMITCCARHTSNGGFTTGDVVSIYGTRFIDDSAMWPYDVNLTVQPGDFLALHGSSGDRGHAGVALAIAADNSYILTTEGNIGDCVIYRSRALFNGSTLDVEIDGVGKVSDEYPYRCSGECVGHTSIP